MSARTKSILMAIPLSIPLVNMIVGIFVGLKMLLSFRSGKHLFVGIALAMVWCATLILQLTVLNSLPRIDMWKVIGGNALHFIYSAWFYHWFLGATDVAIANEKKTSRRRLFEENPGVFTEDRNIGGDNDFLFNQEKRLLAIIEPSSFEIIKFEDIKLYHLKWTEEKNPTGTWYKAVRIELTVNDVNNPTRVLRFNGKPCGEKAKAQLDVLLS